MGIDIGGTNVKLGVLQGDKLVIEAGFPTRSFRPRDAVIQDILSAIAQLRAHAKAKQLEVAAIGIGVPATINRQLGRTLVMPNFAAGWYGFGIVEVIEQATGLPGYLINDARAFVYAESQLGAAKSYPDCFGIILGTGVGGGAVIGRQLHFGRADLAGEIGHHIVEPNGVRCGCGSVGCLETVASAPALVAAVTRPYLHGRCPSLFEATQGDLNRLSAEAICQAAEQGDTPCREALERIGRYLGVATANIITTLSPACIVVGGGLAGAHKLLFPTIVETWRRHACVAGEALPELKLAALRQPGVIGAALYARDGCA
jgi:glucokinase